MGNLFLGFPVSRAKIADMITGTAAPSTHKTQHQDGGSDEIDVTGLVGAGGGGVFPVTYQSFHTTYESLTGFATAASGTGTVTLDEYGVKLDTGLTANSFAQIDKVLNISSSLCSWSKARQNEVSVFLDSLTSATGNFYMFCGILPTQRHVGFRINNGIIYGSVANGSAETNLALETISAVAFSATKTLKVIYTPAISAAFYIDGVLMGTITTTLPTGTTASSMGGFLYAKNTAVAEQKILIVTNVRQIVAE